MYHEIEAELEPTQASEVDLFSTIVNSFQFLRIACKNIHAHIAQKLKNELRWFSFSKHFSFPVLIVHFNYLKTISSPFSLDKIVQGY